VSLRLCVLPLRGVGLKRYGVDGDLLPNKAMAALNPNPNPDPDPDPDPNPKPKPKPNPNKAMAALNELLLDAAPVAPVEEDTVRPLRPLCSPTPCASLLTHSSLRPYCLHSHGTLATERGEWRLERWSHSYRLSPYPL